MAGAIGDALGYTVEFMRLPSILVQYGKDGITEFKLDERGLARISDDTQMTLFTALGALAGTGETLTERMGKAYLDWYYTQTGIGEQKTPSTWLRSLPELAHRRAPGHTCMSACDSLLNGRKVENDSKGCGGIMRVAPVAFVGHCHYEQLAETGAETARITHKHPLGFLPAALMTVLLRQLITITPQQAQHDMENMVRGTLPILDKIYVGEFDDSKQTLRELTEKALRLARSGFTDTEALRQIGEGWVAEETWAVAIYCAVRHTGSVRDAIVASVNHNGDSDSTGSVTGNIMGAIYGYEAIKEQDLFCPKGHKLEETLELSNIILTIADDLASACIARQ